MEKQKDKKEDKKAVPKWFWPVCIFALLFWIANLIVPFLVPSENWADKGIFGDMFGASTSLFSVLAFMGLIYAIFLQKRELGLQREELILQREELVLNRKELAGQKKQLQGQKEQMEIQNFENRFFQLLKIHQQFSQDLLEGKHHTSLNSAASFRRITIRLKKVYSENINSQIGQYKVHDIIGTSYARIFNEFYPMLSNYMRLLYNIFKLVDNSEVNPNRKKEYTNIIRAIMSGDELVVLFYNCISGRGRGKFKPLIEKYSFMKHLDRNKLIEASHVNLYDEKAFR
ncbi:MAG: putative phage abortive infection protein [candidate division Zixibacteria bacterium]|nr:putative phage abortive infection protein [candidate division Zixibacteria bacterium]